MANWTIAAIGGLVAASCSALLAAAVEVIERLLAVAHDVDGIGQAVFLERAQDQFDVRVIVLHQQDSNR